MRGESARRNVEVESSNSERVGVGLTSFAGPAILYVDDARSDGVQDEAVLGPRLAAG